MNSEKRRSVALQLHSRSQRKKKLREKRFTYKADCLQKPPSFSNVVCLLVELYCATENCRGDPLLLRFIKEREQHFWVCSLMNPIPTKFVIIYITLGPCGSSSVIRVNYPRKSKIAYPSHHSANTNRTGKLYTIIRRLRWTRRAKKK